MRKKIYLARALLLVSLALIGCAATSAAEITRTINVTGSSQAHLTPDIARISIGVHTENEDVAAAVAENNRQVEQVMGALREFGIQDKDLRTSNFNLWFMDQWSPEGEVIGMVYAVDNTVYVTVRDLDRMGEVLEAAIEAGANSIYGIEFDASDKSEAISKARDAALENAQKQAEEIAEAAGVTLGAIQTISFYGGGYMPAAYELAVAEGKGGGGGAPMISPGQLTVTVAVNVVYEIGE